ncbi:MAG: hypothetical protein EZS28_034694, partial [Streblomastix strix]
MFQRSFRPFDLADADLGVSYIKGEDDALLLLKFDKTQLIDSYSKSETYSSDDVYTKLEADNLLDNNANQSTTYTKTETDYIISQIDVSDVDLTDYYNITKTDELLGEKADTIELSNYVTLGTSQTITANKTFSNACRFLSSTNGMSTVTGSSFINYGADKTVVLLGAGEQTDDDYITQGAVKSEFLSSIQSDTISNNLIANQFIKSGGTDQQVLLANDTTKAISEFAEVDAKLTKYVNTVNNQSINRTKTFNANINATGFVKTGKDDAAVLLEDGGERLLSSFGIIEDLTSIAFRAAITYIPFPNDTVDKGGY